MRNTNTSLSGGLSFANLSVSAACLSVSAFQAGFWILEVVPNQTQAYVMVAGVISILLGSQVIARMTGQAIVADIAAWAYIMGITCILCIEVLSVSTSTTAFASNMLDSRRTQNTESTEYAFAMQDVANYQRQIDILTIKLADIPANQTTNTNLASKELRLLQRNRERAQGVVNGVDVSISGQAFDGLEDSTGISSADVALIFALLLSIVPLVCNVLAGAFSWRRQDAVAIHGSGEASSGGDVRKKSRARRPLRAV